MAYYSDRDYETHECSSDGTTTPNEDRAVDSGVIYHKQMDLMTFLSVITSSKDTNIEEETSLALLSVHLGPWNLFFPSTPYCGIDFSVTLLPRQYIFRQTGYRIDSSNLIPELVALKTPRLNHNETRNSRLFRSIAKEYQILQSDLLKPHENVVSVFGCCWQSLDIYAGLPIPCLILEGTELGDLVNFSQTRDLTLRERLRLCIHVTSGLQAIHSIDIVHGDLKPRNILVFRSKQHGYTAKIADFGAAILLEATALPCKKPNGTMVYSAPECYDNDKTFDRVQLFKIDIFSLGIVLSALIQGISVVEKVETKAKSSASELESLKRKGLLGDWIVSLSDRDLTDMATQDILDNAEHDEGWETDLAFNEDSILADHQSWAAYVSLLQKTLAASATERFTSEEDILADLRNVLRLHLRKTLGYHEAAARAGSTKPGPLWWSRMSSLLRMSKARMKNVTGASIASTNRLYQEEVEAISLFYLLGRHSKNLFSELEFIRKHTTNKQQRFRRLSKWSYRERQLLSKRRQGRTSYYRNVDTRLILWMRKIAATWVEKQLETPTKLNIIDIEKTVFKVSQNSSLFWLLPHSVRVLLEDQLLHEANNSSMSKDHQAESAYEYAVMVLNSAKLLAPTPEKALDLLAQSAKDGHTNAQCTFGRFHDIFGYTSPVRRQVEIEWLLSASNQGSLTAQKRLYALDPSLFEQNLRDNRCQYDVVCPILGNALNEQSLLAMESDDPLERLFSCIHHSARTGDVKSLLRLAELPGSDFDCVNRLGETPLLIASRSGHTTTATLLLELDSDPSIATNDGITALHFLSVFDDKDIPKMATSLLEHGAELDKLGGKALIYKEMFDSPFGVVEGTPLLWAVAARNTCATQVLVDKGANPFKRIKNPSYYHGDEFEISPIGWAAALHQYQELKILLSYAKNDSQRQDLRRRLNSPSERSHGSSSSVLSIAIDCNPALRFNEYLIHGECLEQLPVKCIKLLIEYGADPKAYSRDTHPIFIASISGNIATLEYLWDYKNGSLRPTPKIWLEALSHVIFNRHHLTFDFLIHHRRDIAPDSTVDETAVKQCLHNSNDQRFVLGSLELVLQQPRPADISLDLAELFDIAVLAGQFEAATLLFQSGGVNPTGRLDNSTVVGRLILVSSHYPNMEQKITFILSLVPNRDELFWNVTYLEGSGVTALHAIVFSSTNGGQMCDGVFCHILDQFNEPQHLNAQIQGAASHMYTGFTALHLAAFCGNFGAVFMILEKPIVNANLLSSHGESPADICVTRELEFARQDMFQQHDSSTRNERQKNIQILRQLLSAGGRISKYSTIIKTLTQDSDNVEIIINKIQDFFMREKYTHKISDDIYRDLIKMYKKR